MVQRRSLIEGLKEIPAVDAEKERGFVFKDKGPMTPVPAAVTAATMTRPAQAVPARVPISTKIRGDYAEALKRASLERQLAHVEPSTLIEILEQAIEPWLIANGYLK
jgi:hypothetical protein